MSCPCAPVLSAFFLPGFPDGFEALVRSVLFKDMGVSGHHLQGGLGQNRPHRRMVLFPEDSSGHQKDQEEIADFAGNIFVIVFQDGFFEFEDLVLEIANQGGQGLFLVEGASIISAKMIYNHDKTPEGREVVGGVGSWCGTGVRALQNRFEVPGGSKDKGRPPDADRIDHVPSIIRGNHMDRKALPFLRMRQRGLNGRRDFGNAPKKVARSLGRGVPNMEVHGRKFQSSRTGGLTR